MGLNDAWIRIPQPRSRAVARLICFPHAGAGAQTFSRWPAQLPQEVELCAVALPGREARMREKPFTDVHSMVSALVPVLTPILDKPFILYGHSMGALVAFELARKLQSQAGPQPMHLIVSGRVAPHRVMPHPPLADLSHEQLLQTLRGLNGTPPEILNDANLMAQLEPMLRADFSVNEKYVYPGPPKLGCDILVFGGLWDPHAGRGALNDWREMTDGTCTLRMVPGDHFFIQSSQSLFLRMLSLELYETLMQATTKSVAACQ